MDFKEIYKRLEAKQSLCLPFHTKDHKVQIKKRAMALSDYLETRKHRIVGKKCDGCWEKTARDDIGTEIKYTTGYNKEKGKEYYFCSEGCRDSFEEQFDRCECGEQFERDDIVEVHGDYLCKTCATDMVIGHGLTRAMLDENHYPACWGGWLEDFLRQAAKIQKKAIAENFKKIGWSKDWEKVETAFNYVAVLNPLIIPTERGWNFYLPKDYDADLETAIGVANVALVIKARI